MITNLYTIYDRKSGMYGTPFASPNDGCAKRDFHAFCSHTANEYIREDLELYKLGAFDSASGCLTDPQKPEFLTNYSEVQNG